jgi:DNA-binding transcriptional MocR family regulator
VNELGAAIVSGDLAAGETLDTEQLAADQQVSRTVVREAIRVLSGKGLVDARPKRGTFVLDRENWNLLTQTCSAGSSASWRNQACSNASTRSALWSSPPPHPKVQTLRTALNAGLINLLVTDVDTAQALTIEQGRETAVADAAGTGM